MASKGNLFVVATPIGNLKDITIRALEVLKDVDFVIAEDTRKAKGLLSHFAIRKPVISLHRHSPKRRVEEIIRRIEEGENAALISEAGTPAISDPGEELLRCCGERSIKTIPIPGPSAITTALSVSGMPAQAFSFFSFLPRGRNKRRKALNEIKNYPHTLVFFEAPHRIIETLEDILEVMGDRRIVLCRELTKIYEEIFRGKVSEALKMLREKGARGEFTIVLEGRLSP
jgi:16S rRNA (cytidine1402-2'-O)-methyltransferase